MTTFVPKPVGVTPVSEVEVMPSPSPYNVLLVPQHLALVSAKAAQVKLDFRPARQEHPFAPGYFKGYNCPRIITAGK